MVTRRGAPGRTGPRDPGEQESNLGVRHDPLPASINSSVKRKDAGFPVIWSHASTKKCSNRIDAPRFHGGGIKALAAKPLTTVPQVETIPLLVENTSVRGRAPVGRAADAIPMPVKRLGSSTA